MMMDWLKLKYKELISTLEEQFQNTKVLIKGRYTFSKHDDLMSLFEEYIVSNSKVKIREWS